MSTSLKLPNVRLSFPDIFEATQYQGKGAFRYNATFLIAPGSPNDKLILAAIEKEAEANFGKNWKAVLNGMRANSNKFCYLDGNTKEYDGYEGMFYLASHRHQEDGPVTVLDQNPKIVLTPADGRPYGGCYVNALVDIYAQNGENQGMRCGLRGVQFFRDGDAFGGSRPAQPDEFDDVSEGAGAGDFGGDDNDLG